MRNTGKIFACFLVVLSVGMILFPAAKVSAAPSGSYFNHIVIIAMENQNYGSVIGSSSAPFINNVLVPAGSTISNYHSYGQNIGSCSAGCYQAMTAGQVVGGDSWCPRASSPCQTVSNIADQLSSAGLTSAMFCEDGCPRGADHFPWIGYTSTWNSCVTGSFTCNGQTGPSGNALYGTTDALGGSTSYSSVQANGGNSAFINYLNSANPANYIWFTPTDSHNMHDNSVSTGDNYLASLLVGSGGSLSNPNSGTVFSTNLFKSQGTMLYIWWDEYDPSPNVEYGTMIKAGYTSTGGYTEYNSLHTIEANWGLPYITSVVSGDASMSDIFGASNPTALTGSFTLSPSAPAPGSAITFTASATGGTGPYTYSWNFGDGNTASGATASHSFATAGSFTVTMTTADNNGATTTTTQHIVVGQTSPLGELPSFSSTTSLLAVGFILGGMASVTLFLVRYHAHNRRLLKKLEE